MFDYLKRDIFTKLAFGWFVLMTVWFLVLYSMGTTEGTHNLAFGVMYGTVPTLVGAIVGLCSAKYWGGWKSVMGKAIIFLSFGLFAQFFGQISFSFYNIVLGVDVPYPSIPDIGYFGNIPMYLIGIFLIARASGVRFSLRSIESRFQAVLIPLVMVSISYYLFLREYDFTNYDYLTVFLDYGYPIGQGLYVSIAILTYGLSRKLLGGVMKKRILLIVAAFVAQYAADFNFLYQNLTGTWYNGGYGDYLYLVAYLFMGVGVFQLRAIILDLRGRRSPVIK